MYRFICVIAVVLSLFSCSSKNTPQNIGDTDTVSDSDTGETGGPELSDDGESFKIRIVAGNISSGNYQSYDPGHGIRIFQALKPDVALVQEMNYGDNSSDDYKEFAQKTVGTNYYAVDSADYRIPNGVVSKYPITSHGYWKDPNISNRALMWAVIDIPGSTDLFAISVHLHTSPSGDQVKAAQVIADEIGKLKSANPGRYYSESELDEYFYPAQKNDSGSSQMQHMAIVKDFLIEY